LTLCPFGGGFGRCKEQGSRGLAQTDATHADQTLTSTKGSFLFFSFPASRHPDFCLKMRHVALTQNETVLLHCPCTSSPGWLFGALPLPGQPSSLQNYEGCARFCSVIALGESKCIKQEKEMWPKTTSNWRAGVYVELRCVYTSSPLRRLSRDQVSELSDKYSIFFLGA
jgi:hypothetical protein